MIKIHSSLVISILLVCLALAVRCQSDFVDWPAHYNTSTYPSGFLKKFQISTDRPKDNTTFAVQAIFYLKSNIEWQGLSDYNLFQMYRIYMGHNITLTLKDRRQFATDHGFYKVGDNITLGFNYTFNTSQNASNGKIRFSLGVQDQKKSQWIQVYFTMPDYSQTDQDKISIQTQTDQRKISIQTQKGDSYRLSGYKKFLNRVKKTHQIGYLAKQQDQGIREIQNVS